jgi:hypothetical protein
MRIMLLAAAALMLGAAFNAVPTSAKAYPVYPWCAFISGRGGATNCYFSTWEQCRQAASGNGGYCYENPFYGAPGYGGTDVTVPWRKYRRYY